MALIHGRHALAITYELECAPGPVQLELRPFFAGRDYHYLMQANESIAAAGMVLRELRDDLGVAGGVVRQQIAGLVLELFEIGIEG